MQCHVWRASYRRRPHGAPPHCSVAKEWRCSQRAECSMEQWIGVTVTPALARRADTKALDLGTQADLNEQLLECLLALQHGRCCMRLHGAEEMVVKKLFFIFASFQLLLRPRPLKGWCSSCSRNLQPAPVARATWRRPGCPGRENCAPQGR